MAVKMNKFVIVGVDSGEQMSNYAGLTFDRSTYEAKLSQIKAGDNIAASCQFSSVHGVDVLATKCELRDSSKQPSR